MFRRFFQRDKQDGQKSDPLEATAPDKPVSNHLKQVTEFLHQQARQQKDDDVHRMVIRTGNQELPEDLAEQTYGGDQGEHIEVARQALQTGDFNRSIYHLGLALASDPLHDEWLALLDQWIAAIGPSGLDLVPLEDKEYFTTLKAVESLMNRSTPTHRMEAIPLVGKNYHARVGVHAYILASQGHTKEAIGLIFQLAQVKPEIPYVLWLLRWQDQPGFADALDPHTMAVIGSSLIQKYPGTYTFSLPGQTEIKRYLPLFQDAYMALSHQQTSEDFLMMAFIYATLLRKSGAFEEAARTIREVPRRSYRTQVALAMAEEALGNLDASIAAYQQALTFQPNDVAVRNDLGKLFLYQGNHARALASYEESAQLAPSDPYQQAFAYIAYLKYLQEPSSEIWLEKLRTLAQEQGSASRLLYLAEAPYIGRLPFAAEATINAIRKIKAANANGGIKLAGGGSTIKLGVSPLESPSACLAAERTVNAMGYSCAISVADVFSPDPRQPLRPVEYQLWHYEDMKPIAVVQAPSAFVAESIALLAQIPYALDRWYAAAHELGQSLGVDALMDLLGVMVHPPVTPVGWEEWDWINAVQLASALMLTAIDTGWEGSRRKAVLTSLIYGPMDWSGAAALIALSVLARQDMHINIEFDLICRDLWHLYPADVMWPLEQATIFGLIFVGDYSDAARAYKKAYFERMIEQQ